MDERFGEDRVRDPYPKKVKLTIQYGHFTATLCLWVADVTPGSSSVAIEYERHTWPNWDVIGNDVELLRRATIAIAAYMEKHGWKLLSMYSERIEDPSDPAKVKTSAFYVFGR